jgi:hypothetical protein
MRVQLLVVKYAGRRMMSLIGFTVNTISAEAQHQTVINHVLLQKVLQIILVTDWSTEKDQPLSSSYTLT